jgi:hypothetical protein
MPYEQVLYRRSDLYHAVWTEPVRVVAAKHGISDVALAKICKKLGVPIPGRGYWAQKTAGRAPPPTPLPKLPPGSREQLLLRRDHIETTGMQIDEGVPALRERARS